MKALTIAKEIQRLLDSDWQADEEVLQQRLDFAKEALQKALPQVKERKELDAILKLDADFTMPVESMIDVYRRIIHLAPNDTEIKKSFAQYLFLHGPEWDDEANEIIALIEKKVKS